MEAGFSKVSDIHKRKYRVKEAFLFLGYMRKYEKMYKNLRGYGYKLIFKPTVKDPTGKIKGNVDAELVLHCAKIEYYNYDEAIIVTGDGDFHCLVEHLLDQKKLCKVIIPNKKKYSKLLLEFRRYLSFVGDFRSKVEKK